MLKPAQSHIELEKCRTHRAIIDPIAKIPPFFHFLRFWNASYPCRIRHISSWRLLNLTARSCKPWRESTSRDVHNAPQKGFLKSNCTGNLQKLRIPSDPKALWIRWWLRWQREKIQSKISMSSSKPRLLYLTHRARQKLSGCSTTNKSNITPTISSSSFTSMPKPQSKKHFMTSLLREAINYNGLYARSFHQSPSVTSYARVGILCLDNISTNQKYEQVIIQLATPAGCYDDRAMHIWPGALHLVRAVIKLSHRVKDLVKAANSGSQHIMRRISSVFHVSNHTLATHSVASFSTHTHWMQEPETSALNLKARGNGPLANYSEKSFIRAVQSANQTPQRVQCSSLCSSTEVSKPNKYARGTRQKCSIES